MLPHQFWLLEALQQPRVELLCALRADAVAETGFRMFTDIGFQLRPITLIVPDLMAVSAYGQDPPQIPDLLKGFLEFGMGQRIRDRQADVLSDHFKIFNQRFRKHPLAAIVELDQTNPLTSRLDGDQSHRFIPAGVAVISRASLAVCLACSSQEGCRVIGPETPPSVKKGRAGSNWPLMTFPHMQSRK
jgi:hypothetical protein